MTKTVGFVSGVTIGLIATAAAYALNRRAGRKRSAVSVNQPFSMDRNLERLRELFDVSPTTRNRPLLFDFDINGSPGSSGASRVTGSSS